MTAGARAGHSSPGEAETSGRYVYGVIRCGCEPGAEELTGIAGASVDFVVSGRLAAVTSEVSRRDLSRPEQDDTETARFEAAVRAHEDIVEACLSHGPVVPFRFGTAVRTRADVRRLLEARHAFWTAELDRLDRKHEWGVKAMLNQAALSSWVRANRPDLLRREGELDAEGAGAAYFGRKRLQHAVSAEGDAVVAERTAEAHDRLASCAIDATLLPVRRRRGSSVEHMCLNAAYLVPEEAEERFRAELQTLAREQASIGLRYELTGPWPAYNFLSGEPGAL